MHQFCNPLLVFKNATNQLGRSSFLKFVRQTFLENLSNVNCAYVEKNMLAFTKVPARSASDEGQGNPFRLRHSSGSSIVK